MGRGDPPGVGEVGGKGQHNAWIKRIKETNRLRGKGGSERQRVSQIL